MVAGSDRRSALKITLTAGVALALALGSTLGAGAAPAQPADTTVTTQAAQALARGDLDTAESGFRSVLETSADDLQALLGLAAVMEMKGSIAEALEWARRASDVAPQNAVVRLTLGRLLAQLGNYEEAHRALAEVHELAPDNVQAYLLPALLLRETGDADAAIRRLQNAVARGIRDPRPSEELAFLLLDASRPDEALEVAEQAAAQYPDRPKLNVAVGLALKAHPDRWPDAVGYLRRGLELGIPNAGVVQMELGSVLLELGRPQEAVEILEEAIRVLPDSPDAYYQLAQARLAVGDDAGATEALERFQQARTRADEIDREAKDRGASLNRARELAMQDKLDEALEATESILEQAPGYAEALSLQAKILYSMGRFDDALAGIRKAQQSAPDRLEYPYLEGAFLVGTERFDEAQAVLDRVVAIDPALGEAHQLLGLVHLRQERPTEAAHHFGRALELGVDNAELRRAYSQVMRELEPDAGSPDAGSPEQLQAR